MQREKITAPKITKLLCHIRKEKPLVHMLPNSVSASFCADALAALGARPVMAVCAQEMEEIVSYADALVVNMGQPDERKQEAAQCALRAAGKRGIPVILDPVGAGASAYRLGSLEDLMAIPWQGIVKGNEAELYALFTGRLTHEGIDSLGGHRAEFIKPERMKTLLGSGERIFVSTGRENRIFGKPDFVSPRQENRNFGKEAGELALWGTMCHREAPAYGLVGTGCMTGAIIGAFCTAAKEAAMVQGYGPAVQAALLTVGFVQEQAADASGYGSFRQKILDGLSRFTGEEEAFASYLTRPECFRQNIASKY